MTNVLDQPSVHHLNTAGLSRRQTLPQLLAALTRDDVESFPALRPHQVPAWHMFLVQLGAIAMHRAGLQEPPEDASTWRSIIRDLTAEQFPDDEPWRLVVEDETKPAFLQPPVPEVEDETKPASRQPAVPERVKLNNVIGTPDALDMLLIARNHELKQSIAEQAVAEDWVFALVSLQTMEGYNGSGNYGIARMNGGSSSRVCLGLAPMSGPLGNPSPVRPGLRFRRDLTQIIQRRQELLDRVPGLYSAPGGPALLWTVAWPKRAQLHIPDLDPFFIEVCRRIRLCQTDGLLSARAGTSAKRRIDAEAYRGVLGDPWAPVHRADGKALTLGDNGDFGYGRIVDLMLSPDWKPPLLATLGPGEADQAVNWLLVAHALARGNSKSGGFKERIIPLTGHVTRGLGVKRKELHDLACHQMDEIKKVDRCLRDAIVLFVAGGEFENVDEDAYKLTRPHRARLEVEADRIFFDHLWTRFEADQSGGEPARLKSREKFVCELVAVARSLLDEALADLPCPAMRRLRAETRARRVFEGKLRQEKSGFPGIFAPKPKLGRPLMPSSDTAASPQAIEAPPATQAGQPRTIADAETVARIGRHFAELDPGPLAELRRIDVAAPDFNAPYFWLLAARFGFPQSQERKWAHIVQIMALLTEKGRNDNKRSPHQSCCEANGWRGLGTALCDGADPVWPRGEHLPRPVYSETRLARLLAARGEMRADLMERAARMLAARKPPGAPVDCTDIARLLLRENDPNLVRQIARDYYARLDRAERAASQNETTDNTGETA